MKNKLYNLTNSGFLAFIYYIIPFGIFLDIIYIFLPLEGYIIKSPLAALKAIVLLSFLLYVMFSTKFVLNSISNRIIIFSFYIFLLFPFSSNLIYSLRISLQILISLFGFIMGFILINSIDDLIKLNKSILLSMLLIILNFVLSDLLNLGGTDYTRGDDFQAGGLQDGYNLMTYTLLLLPLMITLSKSKVERYGFFSIGAVVFVLLLLSLKRTAIAGCLFGYILYFLQYKNKGKLFLYLLVFLMILVILLPFYSDILAIRFAARSEAGRFSNDFYESEGRFIETIFVWKSVFSFDDVIRSIFGLEAFNSVGHYLGGIFGSRQLHVDFNLILFTNGLFGLFIYLSIYTALYSGVKKFSRYKDDYINGTFIAIYKVLLFASLFTSFGGQMYHISFRLIIFLYLGAILSLLEKRNYNMQKELV